MKHVWMIMAGILIGAVLMACGTEENTVKYKLILNGGFSEPEKTEYAAGERVTVRYDSIATDTDYRFYSEDVELRQDFDGGYVITFVMPEHDVTLNAESRNSMEYNQDVHDTEETAGTAELTFASFDGGGPEFHVRVKDTGIVSCKKDVRYHRADHDEIDGAGKDVVVIFTGIKPGQTDVTIEERSPIADNLDRLYSVTVDDELHVHIEEIAVKETD